MLKDNRVTQKVAKLQPLHFLLSRILSDNLQKLFVFPGTLTERGSDSPRRKGKEQFKKRERA